LAFHGNLYTDYQLRIGFDRALSRRLEPLIIGLKPIFLYIPVIKPRFAVFT